MREIEEWRDIEGYECLYQVSSLGNVKSLPRETNNQFSWCERILNPGKDKNGYLHVVLCNDGKTKTYKVHRLVANAFIPNPKNLPEVNHKDEDKTNNKVDNLEWMTSKENTRYSKAIAVNQYTKSGEYIRTWNCIKDIQYHLGYDPSSIVKCCKEIPNYNSAYGFLWKYAN